MIIVGEAERRRNYAFPQIVFNLFVGQIEFGIAVTEGYNAGKPSLREFWIHSRIENSFEWKWFTLFEGATIVGEAIRDTVLSDTEVFLQAMRFGEKLICSHRYRYAPSQYFAICIDRNGDTTFGVFDAEDNTFTPTFDLLQDLARSNHKREKKEN